MTVQRARAECWMKFENGKPDRDLDKRVRQVEQCVDEKMQGRPGQ
jgi:hypothetical protein